MVSVIFNQNSLILSFSETFLHLFNSLSIPQKKNGVSKLSLLSTLFRWDNSEAHILLYSPILSGESVADTLTQMSCCRFTEKCVLWEYSPHFSLLDNNEWFPLSEVLLWVYSWCMGAQRGLIGSISSAWVSTNGKWVMAENADIFLTSVTERKQAIGISAISACIGIYFPVKQKWM